MKKLLLLPLILFVMGCGLKSQEETDWDHYWRHAGFLQVKDGTVNRALSKGYTLHGSGVEANDIVNRLIDLEEKLKVLEPVKISTTTKNLQGEPFDLDERTAECKAAGGDFAIFPLGVTHSDKLTAFCTIRSKELWRIEF